MTSQSDTLGRGSETPSVPVQFPRWPLVRWFIAYAAFGVPQAAAPIAFSLLALSLTGDASGGAAIILAMTVAQVAGAVPIARFGRNINAVTFLRLLVGIRTLALALIGVLAAYGAPIPWLVGVAIIGGLVNGTAYGYMRSILNHLTVASQLPRALGVAATLNELTFVVAPVMASGLGVTSPVFAVFALAFLGAAPIVLIRDIQQTRFDSAVLATGSTLSPPVMLWLLSAATGGAVVAAIEIGAVALALNFGFEPVFGAVFTVSLCIASAASGVWVVVRNRVPSTKTVTIYLFVMAMGSILVALELSVLVTAIGAVVVGSVLAPLGTYYSLVLDTLAPPHRRAEIFALLRTANSVGIIFASAVLTVFSLSITLTAVAGMMVVVTLIVGVFTYRRR